jgi:hypothetical protein
MKKFNIIASLICCITLSACEKLQLDELQFDVSTSKTVFKVGEEVVFNFTGNPDNITFYSGEIGKQYEFKDRTSAVGTAQLQFTSFLQNNKPNTLKFLASTDFSGVVDSASIVNATWIDITNRVTLSSGLDNTASGVVDLSDLRDLNKKVYFAFRFTDVSSTTAQATWTLRNFVVRNTVDDRTFEIMNLADAGWGRFSMINKTNIWTVSATGLRFTGGAANTPNNDAWVIARPADLNFVARDLGESIKDLNQRLMPQTYIYNTPGTYKVAFIGLKSNVETTKSIVRELTITIEP